MLGDGPCIMLSVGMAASVVAEGDNGFRVEVDRNNEPRESCATLLGAKKTFFCYCPLVFIVDSF